MRTLPLVPLAALALSVCFADEPGADLAHDEKLLTNAGVSADGPGLLDFFRARTLSESDRAALAATVRRLGDASFEAREKASQDLIRAGRHAVKPLREALADPDLEVRRRAERCLEAIEESPALALQAAAARLVAARRPDGAAEVLLAFLPAVEEASVEEAVHDALAAVAVRGGKAEPAVMAALADKEPARRAGAAFALGRAGGEWLKPVRPLLTDPDAAVRFRAAAALLRGGDKDAVPVLIALLAAGPPPLAWRAEDLLCRVGGERAPAAPLGGADEAARARCRDAWKEWWKANEDRTDLARVNFDEALRGVTVVCDLDAAKGTPGRVWECGADGQARWHTEAPQGPIDVQVLPGGRFLVAEHRATRVTERDRDGKVLWEQRVENSPVSCQRLANGNTFIATYNQVLEVTRDGRTVYAHKVPGGTLWNARRTRDGHIVCVLGSNQLLEMDVGGKEVRRVPLGNTSGWGSVEVLASGRYLVAQWGANRVVEVDAAGKVFWECNVQSPASATRLRNGHVLVASTEGRAVFEFDRSGKEVAKIPTQGRPFRARRY